MGGSEMMLRAPDVLHDPECLVFTLRSSFTVGGYYVVEAASRAQAVDLATRCPHARWSSVEVREVMKVGPM